MIDVAECWSVISSSKMATRVEVEDGILVKFAQKLAGNEKKYRDRAVKKLRKWLETRLESPTGWVLLFNKFTLSLKVKV